MKRWFPRYEKAPEILSPIVPFAWDKCYEHRKNHLAQMIVRNAPETIMEMACRNMLKAIARSHKSRWAILRWAWHDLNMQLALAWFKVKWNWCRVVRGWSHEECEHYFFEDYEQELDPEVKELRKMTGLSKEEDQ